MDTRIAHFNVARLRHPPGDARVAEFIDNVTRVNSIAERSHGFIWRLSEESSQVTREGYTGSTGNPCVVYSLSTWQTFSDLQAFVQKTVHGAFLRRRAEWFEPWDGPNYVIWPYHDAAPPSVDLGWNRLGHLKDHGASELAYDFHYGASRKDG